MVHQILHNYVKDEWQQRSVVRSYQIMKEMKGNIEIKKKRGSVETYKRSIGRDSVSYQVGLCLTHSRKTSL